MFGIGIIKKKALALWLGLFCCFVLTLQAQEDSDSVSGEVSAGTGTLWVDDEGAALYWNSGLTVNLGQHFFLGVDLGQVSSSLPWMNTAVFGFLGQFGVDMPGGGFTIAAGFFNQSPVNASVEKIAISSNGGQGYFLSFETSLHFGPLSILPSFLFGEAAWEYGDLYYFFGKPAIPSLRVYGLDITLDQPDQYRHGLGFRGFSANLKILDNEDVSLFDSHLSGGLLLYQFSLERSKTWFSGTVGWLFARASLDGVLNTLNQPYFLFPFLFFDISACLEAHAGVALFRFRHSHGIFRYSFDLGAFHIFYNTGMIDTHYRQKRLFGGKEVFDKMNPDIGGLGAAFLLLEAALPGIPIGNGDQRLSLELQKRFIVPWGYEKLFPGDSMTVSAGAESATSSLIKSVLLSGWSIKSSLIW